MQSSKLKNHQQKPRNKRPTRYNNEPSSGFYSSDNRRRGNQGRFYPKNEDQREAEYRRQHNTRETVYIYKQDLIQKGFDVYQSSSINPNLNDLIDRFSECFNSTKRKVIIELGEPVFEETSEFSHSRIQVKEELKEDFGHLMENEDIPDWFLDSSQANHKISFDFGNAIVRSQNLNKEISKRIDSNPLELQKTVDLQKEMNFDELDKIIESEYKKSKAHIQTEDEDMLEFELEPGVDSPRKSDIPKYNFHDQSNSINDSSDYFSNLQTNLHKMIFKDKQISSNDEKESDESFHESLGFEAKREGKVAKPEFQEKILPSELVANNELKNIYSNIKPVEQILIPPNVMSVNRALCDGINEETNEKDPLKEAIESFYHSATEAEKEISKK